MNDNHTGKYNQQQPSYLYNDLDSWTELIISTWKLVRNAGSQASEQESAF